MSEPASPELLNQHPLAEQIWTTLEKSEGRENVNEARRRRQELILMKFPQDFDLEIKASANYVEKMTKDALDKQLRGEIFEQLVRADTNICSKTETREAKLLRSVMKNPSIYGLEQNGLGAQIRNPDIAIINDEGQITGAVEVKSGKINERASKQLGEFVPNINKVVNIIKHLGKGVLDKHGLGVFVGDQEKLKVAPDFAITLAIPHGVYNGDVKMLIDNNQFDNSEDVRLTEERLKKCTIIESPFSRRDLWVIANFVINWYKGQSPQAEAPKIAQ